MSDADSPEALSDLIERYNDAWNRQDVDAIDSMHTEDIVFHNHTAGESVEGSDKVREHIASNLRRFRSIVESPAFRRKAGTLEGGQKLQRVPRGFPPDHPAAEYLRFRMFVAGRVLKG